MNLIACTCKTCAAAFESKVPRTFCSVKCRAADPEFRAVLLANLARPKSRSGPERAGVIMPCVACGAEVYLTASARKRGKKACSRSCYRAWMADRFDRNIGAVHQVGAMSGFDEFLSQDQLQCLVAGCAWQGADLGLHANLSHGIAAAAMKAAAGFNANTGLVSGPLLRIYEARGGKGHSASLNRQAAMQAHPRQAQRRSAEAIEHYEKAMALRGATR